MLKNNVPDALDFIEKFSILTRTILNVTETELSTIEEELKTTKHYMDIEKIRFRNFDYKILISDEAKSSSILVPSLILQPIVENAIWHGFQKKTEQKPGLILVSVSVENHKMEITIEDNGVGRKVTEKIASHKSKGLSTLRKRLELLNKSKVKIDFIDLYEDNVPTGTKVLITLVQKN